MLLWLPAARHAPSPCLLRPLLTPAVTRCNGMLLGVMVCYYGYMG